MLKPIAQGRRGVRAARGVAAGAVVGWCLASPALAADLIENGTFVAEDFGTAQGWQAIDDKSGSEHAAQNLAVWSEGEPYYGAILRVCQDAAEVNGSSGGVWGAHIAQSVPLKAGHTYTLGFWAANLGPVVSAEGDPSCPLHENPSGALQVQVYGQSSGELLSQPVSVAACSSTCGSAHEYEFVAPSDDTATLSFFFGGQWAKLKLSGVVLNETAPGGGDPEPGAGGRVSVNGVGYLPAGPKLATVRSPTLTSMPWELQSSEGATLASGNTLPYGADTLSGDTLQRIDFSSFTGTGNGLRLLVDGVASPTFDVRADVYEGLARDSLRFYYHQRCGQALPLEHAESSTYARASDHGGDAAASCSPGQTCSSGYPLDVSQGWHDAGDYGKYVVPGAISVWTLMNLYERALFWSGSSSGFADGALNTAPSNGVPDVLDEARQELEFLLGMQVPEGNPLAGMAHHKVHSDDWVSMPTHPESDSSTRLLRPPSTAATFDLAAAAAQCARIWRELDPAFAARCLTAAERAWTAALAHPDLYAPASSNVGGGPYDDSYVGDERYWAAAELFATTGKEEYASQLRASSHFAGFNPGVNIGPFSWPGPAGLGTISLALVPNALAASEVTQMRQAIVDDAEAFLQAQAQNGYGVPLVNVAWGSNGDALNAGVVLALAHDLTGEARFLRGAAATLDYVLGQNPFARSFVTGHGTDPVSLIHHTNFAPYLNASFAPPPPGFIVGGPNAYLDSFPDPGVSTDCSPLRCWSETSGAYWFVEVAINWNAPLAWLSAWLDEQGQGPARTPVGVAASGSSDGGSGGSSGSAGNGSGGDGSGGDGSTGGAGAGSPGGAGSDPDLSGPATLDSSSPGSAAEEAAGCACRVGPASSHAGGLWLAAALALAGLRRRRPRA